MVDDRPEHEPETPQAEAADKAETRPLTCFVIGPIGSRHAPQDSDDRLSYEEALQVVEEVIIPACDSLGLHPVRADGLSRAGEITDQVFRRLRDDDVVIADLTGANPNVMYELGLRHTRDKLTVQVGEYGRLPFDINVIRTVQFSRSPYGLITARNELLGILEAGLNGAYDHVSATRIWNETGDQFKTIGVVDDRQDGDERLELEEPAGFVDLLAAGEDGLDRITVAVEDISASLEAMGELAVRGTEKMAASDARGGGMRGRLALTIEFADGLSNVADLLEAAVIEYVGAMSDVSLANIAIIERLEEEPTQLSDAMNWALLTRRLAETAREGLANLSEFADTVSHNAKLARVLREPSRKILGSLEAFAAATSVADEWDRRLQALGVPVPPDEWDIPAAEAGDAERRGVDRPDDSTDSALLAGD